MRTIMNMILILSSLAATSLAAHPHVFVDTGFELITNKAGQLTHVRVTWEYDEFYSLLITEDMGLDGDGDGVLTKAENETLTGFDMQWIDGFNGDLMLTVEDKPITVSGPQEVTANFANGRITTTHLRALERPVLAGETLVMKAYDPTYYTAYELALPVTVSRDRKCDVRRKAPEMDDGLRSLQKQLSALDAGSDPQDVGLPNIGGQLASSVSVTCVAS
jgi:ABC-type uncharacterized transport system substrate-binding protein